MADGSGDWAAIWYVARDGSHGVLFAFRLGSRGGFAFVSAAGAGCGLRYRVSLYSGAATEAMADALMAE